MSSESRALALLGVLFTCSGVNGLMVEQIFEKLLTTVVGSAVESGAIVLAVFFAGLFAGGVAYPLASRRVSSPFVLYALLEIVVGLCGLGLAVAFSPIQTISSQVLHLAGMHPVAVLAARVAVACVWMLPPTIAMGATYPAVVRMVSHLDPTGIPRWLARFYALNLLGAVASAALCPYVLFPRFGLGGVLKGAALLQLVVAAVAVGIGRHRRTPIDAAPSGEAEPPRLRIREGAVLLLLLASLLSGLVTFAMEVLWFHLIGVTLGMSAYAFGLMLAVVLFGLFVGSSLVGVMPASGALSKMAAPIALGLSTLALALTHGLWDDVPRWLLECGSGLSDFACGGPVTSFASAERVRLRVALLLVGLPAVPLGMVYPSLLRAPFYPYSAADRAAGLLGAANAVGSVTGALVASFVLIPGLGAERSVRLLAVLPAAVGAAVCWILVRRGVLRRPSLVALVLNIVALVAALVPTTPWDRLALTAGTNVYFRRHHVHRDSKLEFWHEDSTGGIVTVVSRRVADRDVKTLLTNGKFQGNDSGEIAAQVALALLPCVAAPNRDKALVIGLGTGHSAEVVHAAGFAEIDVAEISSGIVEAARAHFAHVNRHVLDRPNVTLFLEDGRNHLVRTRRRYDVISIELSSVWFAGVNNIYSREFYALAASRMVDGGVLQQWIQLHHLSVEEVASVIATMRDVFSSVELWFVGDQGIVLASNRPLRLSRERFESIARQPGLAHDIEALRRFPNLAPEQLARRMLLATDDVDAVAVWLRERGVPLNTDTNRFLEYSTPRHALAADLTPDRMARALLDLLPPARRDARLSALGLK
jgi:spermidine synthase